jgi:hypothetical protein
VRLMQWTSVNDFPVLVSFKRPYKYKNLLFYEKSYAFQSLISNGLISSAIFLQQK